MGRSSTLPLEDIEDCLEKCQVQLNDVSRCFDASEGIYTGTRVFTREAMLLGRTVDRLISKAAAMINQLIEALETESRALTEQANDE